MARIIPRGNLFERKNSDSTWVAMVETPYIPMQMAPTSGQPCQLDRRIRYDRTTPTETEKIRKAPRRFSGCGFAGASGKVEIAGSAGGACCAILAMPERVPPAAKDKANTRHTARTLRPVAKTLPTVITATLCGTGYSTPTKPFARDLVRSESRARFRPTVQVSRRPEKRVVLPW